MQISSGAAGGLPSLRDPTELVARFQEGGLAALVQTPAQRDILDRVQAAMAVVEGHAEHVMDALAPELVPRHEGLRESMERRRDDRSAPERILMRLLGMDMKMRQYRQGKAFCDAVADEGGTALLNGVWDSPDALPTLGGAHAARALDRPLVALCVTDITRNGPPEGVYVHVFGGIVLLSLEVITFRGFPVKER